MMKKTKIRREEMMRIVGKGDEENEVWKEEMMGMGGKRDEENVVWREEMVRMGGKRDEERFDIKWKGWIHVNLAEKI